MRSFMNAGIISQRDVGDLEAVLDHPLAQLRILVDRVHHVGHLLAHGGRRRLRHADAAIGAVDPVEAELLNVGTSGNCGRRFSVATASIRILPFCWIASVEYDIAAET